MDGNLLPLFPDLENRSSIPDRGTGCVSPIGRRRAPPRQSARRSRSPRPSIGTLIGLLSEIRGLVLGELGNIRVDLRRLEQAIGRQSKISAHDSENIAGLLRQVAQIARTLETIEPHRMPRVSRRRPLS
jgi:hypothetical protein